MFDLDKYYNEYFKDQRFIQRFSNQRGHSLYICIEKIYGNVDICMWKNNSALTGGCGAHGRYSTDSTILLDLPPLPLDTKQAIIENITELFYMVPAYGWFPVALGNDRERQIEHWCGDTKAEVR